MNRGPAYTLGILAALTAGPAVAADVTIDRGTTYQTIEGFGFFGAADVWWSSASAVLDQAWTDKVIDDLGVTMWRNEYYAEGTPQDADWAKQKPVVQALVKAADQRGVKLKILLTVWSPPASLKCASDDDTTCNSNPPKRPADTKGGNALDPALRADLAAWLVAGAKMYHDAGADLYAVSFQNEPLFNEPYNSCVYSQEHYAATLAAIGPTIKAAFPDLKLFGSENMLGIECGKSPGTAFDPYWYTANIMKVPEALAAIDAFAVHGYVDGVSATATSNLAAMWTSFRDGTAKTGKRIWMTETSGYFHTWPGTQDQPGPLDLGQAIYAALAYGNLSAWTYWQGSEKDGFTEYSLMAGASKPGKNYHVSKQFFRYVRPGAQRVDAKSSDPEVMVVAFQHPTLNAFTLVAINVGSTSKTVTLSGAGLPTDFQAFRSSAKEDAAELGTVAADSLTLPASSITTFVNGSYREQPSSSGTGGATGTGGRTGAGGSTGSTVSSGGRTSSGSSGGSRTGGSSGGGGRIGTGGMVGSGGAIGAGGATRGAGGAIGVGGTVGRDAGLARDATSADATGTDAQPAAGSTGSGAGAHAAGGAPGTIVTADAGRSDASGKDSAGCSCRMSAARRNTDALWQLAGAGLALAVAARARKRKARGRRRKPEQEQLVSDLAGPVSASVGEGCCSANGKPCFPSLFLCNIQEIRIFERDLANVFGRARQNPPRKISPGPHG